MNNRDLSFEGLPPLSSKTKHRARNGFQLMMTTKIDPESYIQNNNAAEVIIKNSETPKEDDLNKLKKKIQ